MAQIIFCIVYLILIPRILSPVIDLVNLHCRDFFKAMAITYFIITLATIPIILALRSLV